ncbi:MAG: ATP-dependent zinc metalloprotease FtsH [Chloroflexi bacterium]|nr:ATP-dependent zinc metalloprotease FtsH [Chloroflexota bacterium]
MRGKNWFKENSALVVAGLGLLLFIFVFPLLVAAPAEGQVPISTVVEKVKAGEVAKITTSEDSNFLTVHYKSGDKALSRKEPHLTLLEYLTRAGVPLDQMPAIEVSGGRGWLLPAATYGQLGAMLLPVLLMGGLVLLLLLFARRQVGDSTDQAFSFGKSRARRFVGGLQNTTFADVAGVQEAKEELWEIVEFLKHPERFTAVGARMPKGLLLVGPPGTGKTLLARAVAGEAGVPFFNISGSEFVEMFVGVGASRVRDLFQQAKAHAPCIVFVDEIDAVGRQRGAGLGGGHDEREQTLNQILVEMDGFDKNTNVIVMAATNRPDVLDPALLRPGRFDRQIILDRPDLRGRKAILEVHARGKPLAADVDLEQLAKQTSGFSGADLENVINEAAILAARRGARQIERGDLEEAIDRVLSGPARKSRLISEKEKAITAYHEIGHALVARLLPHADPVHKVTIVARGLMGGYTRLLPAEDRQLWTKSQFTDTLCWTLAGSVAEEMIFGEVSTGAANDIERATNLARDMVCRYGMSEKLGRVAFGHREEMLFLGREIAQQRNYSDQVAYEIDQEIHRLIEEARQRAEELLTTHRDNLVHLSELLIQRETLEGEELRGLLALPQEGVGGYQPAVAS